MAESFLGLRHGPMSAIRPDTLVVAFLSSRPAGPGLRDATFSASSIARASARRRVIVGAGVPAGRRRLARRARPRRAGAVARFADEDLTLLDALVGQLLAFFRCLDRGYRPDSPSEDGVITRVVSGFEIHRPNGAR